MQYVRSDKSVFFWIKITKFFLKKNTFDLKFKILIQTLARTKDAQPSSVQEKKKKVVVYLV